MSERARQRRVINVSGVHKFCLAEMNAAFTGNRRLIWSREKLASYELITSGETSHLWQPSGNAEKTHGRAKGKMFFAIN